MTELVSQPLLLAVLAGYAVLLLPPCIAYRRAAHAHRLIALVLVGTAVATRLVSFGDTPPGWGSDDAGALIDMNRWETWTWQIIFGETTLNGGPGLVNLPWYLTYRVTDSWLASRIVGAIWSAVLAGYGFLFVARLWGAACGVVAVAVFCITPWSLFLSRFTFGAEILVWQLYLIAASYYLLKRANWRNALACGLLLALLQYTYIIARISVVIPSAVIALGWSVRSKRTVAHAALAYVVAALCVIPHVATHPRNFWTAGQMTTYDANLSNPWHMAEKAWLVIKSLIWSEYGLNGTLAMQGAQVLHPVVLGLIVVGLWSCRKGLGRTFVALAALGMVPCWLSPFWGNSHRMMMMLVPLGLIAGASMRVVPKMREGIAGVCAILIVATTMHVWLSPVFWQPLEKLGPMQWAFEYRRLVKSQLDSGVTKIVPLRAEAQLVEQERRR